MTSAWGFQSHILSARTIRGFCDLADAGATKRTGAPALTQGMAQLPTHTQARKKHRTSGGPSMPLSTAGAAPSPSIQPSGMSTKSQQAAITHTVLPATALKAQQPAATTKLPKCKADEVSPAQAVGRKEAEQPKVMRFDKEQAKRRTPATSHAQPPQSSSLSKLPGTLTENPKA